MQIYNDLLVPSCFIQTYDSVLNKKVVYACNESFTKGILFLSNNVKLSENAYSFFKELNDAELNEKGFYGVLKAFLYQPAVVKHHLMMESIFLCFDYGEQLFYYLNMELNGVFIKNSSEKFVELTDGYVLPEEEEFGAKQFPYFPMQEIRHLYVASNELGSLLYKKLYDEVFSEKDLLDYVNYLGESLLEKEERFSFFFMNCEVSGEVEFRRRFTLYARIESVEEVEMELEKLLNRFYNDLNANAKTILVVNELLMNAYEHGVLGIDPHTKQEKMEEGKYDTFLKEREVSSKGCIDVEAVLYKSGVLKIMIDDHGKGFDFKKQLDEGLPEESAYRGRGLMMSLNMANAVFYSKNGSQVTFFVRYMLKEREMEVDAHLSDQDILRQMSVLYVEDEHMIQSLLMEVIKPKVKILYVASDGQEGLELFNRHHPDIVITDVNMPILDGLKMSRFIKKISHNTPIIVTTAHDYEANLYRALEIGIDKFLTKPVELNQVNKVLKQFAKKVYANKMSKLSGIDYDLERLRAKNSYLDCQQKKAFKKQQLIIHDDTEKLTRFETRVLYRPKEILSGDTYGLFRLDDDRIFIFVIDCMDLGMIASVNAVLSAAYINRSVSKALKKERFSLEKILKGYSSYIQKYLLEDECLSFTMAVVDLNMQQLEYTGCGMYPLLLKEQGGQQVEQLGMNRPHLMGGDSLSDICTCVLPEIFSLYLFSDGICSLKGFSYQDFLALVKAEENCAEIEQTVMWKFDSESGQDSPKDDMTLIWIGSKRP